MAVTKFGSISKGISSAPLVAERTYTASAFRGLTTYEEIIPAPGADKAVIVDGVTIFKDGSTAFGSIAAGDDLEVRHASATGAEIMDVEKYGFP